MKQPQGQYENAKHDKTALKGGKARFVMDEHADEIAAARDGMSEEK